MSESAPQTKYVGRLSSSKPAKPKTPFSGKTKKAKKKAKSY